MEAHKGHFPVIKKGILIFSHLPLSSGALHFSVLLDSHKTFSEQPLSWNWGMFSVSQVKQSRVGGAIIHHCTPRLTK